MRDRRGFITNSSSSSFIISRIHLSPFQILAIRDHIAAAKHLDMGDYDSNDAWVIDETEESIKGYTTIDNFNMEKFLEKIHVHSNWITWRE